MTFPSCSIIGVINSSFGRSAYSAKDLVSSCVVVVRFTIIVKVRVLWEICTKGACIRTKRIVRPSRPRGNGESAIFADVLLEEE